ncbi:MAG TPA: copper chaperone PCu(A)C [Caldimonas sp.]|nr:copper chaperone PCu(A)C [Caldimonas sp.]
MHHPSTLRRATALVLAALVVSSLGALAGAPVSVLAAASTGIRVEHPFATPSVPGATMGAAYFGVLENHGAKPDKLVRATTPVAASVEMHTMAVDPHGVMRMREVDGIAIAPGGVVRMRPGMGYHLMLVGLKQPLKPGESFPMSLQFEHAGNVDVTVVVQAMGGAAPMSGMLGMPGMSGMPKH